MFRPLITILLLSGLLLASPNYTVRVAVFKYSKNLERGLSKLPPALRDTIQTYKKRNRTFVHTIPTKDKKVLKKLLPAYRKVFRDAYISKTRLK